MTTNQTAKTPDEGNKPLKMYILITAEVGRSPVIQETLRKPEHKHIVKQIDAVAGTYDLVATLEGTDPQTLGSFVMGVIQRTEGVLYTISLWSVG